MENAAFAIARFSWALLPVALLFALRPILPFAWAVAVVALVVFSPGIYLNGSTINTDVPTLLLIVFATGLLIRGVGERPRVGLLISTGLLLGLAYALRNSVTAVFAGMLAAFVGAVLLKQMPVAAAARNCAWVLLGSAPFVGLLLLRNYLVFGEVQPYVLMVGTDATLLESFRVYLHGLLWDLTGSPTLARTLAWDSKILALTATPIAGLLAWGLFSHWRVSGLHARFAVLYGLLFSAAGAAMLVIAHTYHGLDFGFLLRHMMQYAWLLFALMLVALLATGERKAKLLAGLLVAVLLASRLWFIADDLRTERAIQAAFSRSDNVVEAAHPFLENGRILTDQIKQRLAEDETIPAAIRALPGNALVLSNQGPLLGYLSGRPVRMLPFSSETDLSDVTSRVSRLFRDMHSHRPVYIALVPDNRIVRSPDGAVWQAKIASRLPEQYQVIRKEANILVLHVSAPAPEAIGEK
ncbi:MAG: hypothetical protein B7Y41_04680 [Hydrogenophilales bacterium 28-61-23]|nr:MAG: hypothetical protein B7Y41_04680 [Hydrogenophilales bacterium 28-61-23]